MTARSLSIAIAALAQAVEHSALDQPYDHADDNDDERDEEDPEAPAHQCAVLLFAVLAC